MHHDKIKGTRTEMCWCNTPVSGNQVCWEDLIVGVSMADRLGLANHVMGNHKGSVLKIARGGMHHVWAITKALCWRLPDEYLVCEGFLGPSRLLLYLILDAVFWWSTRMGGQSDVDQVVNLLKSHAPGRAPTCRPSAEPTAVPSAYMKTKRWAYAVPSTW